MTLRTRVIGNLTITFLVFLTLQPIVVQPAPTSTPTASGSDGAIVSDSKVDLDEVKQLEDLKQSLGKSFAVLQAHAALHYKDSEGNQRSHEGTREETMKDGELVAQLEQELSSVKGKHNATPEARIHTEVEIPSRGIHKIVDESLDQGQREIPFNFERRSSPESSNHVENRFPSSTGMQYSPRDMAEYVFWTGDEKGVTLAIEEFLADGLMSREEAISFLQDIKINLDYLQLHYSHQQRFHKPDEQDFVNLAAKEKSFAMMNKANNGDEQNYNLPYETKKRMPSERIAGNHDEIQPPAFGVGISEADYEELLERLRVADFLYTEYSLEEVIYQLAKVMFSQSLSKGSTEAQEALQKFTAFLEAESEKGRISKTLEKKVLDVLIASLSDTLTEHPQLLSSAENISKESSTASANHLLHQLIMLNPATATGDATSTSRGNVKANKLRNGSALESHQSTLAKAREIINMGKANINEPMRLDNPVKSN